MASLRDKLSAARRGYQQVRYPGDLAEDVFARLDAGEQHDASDRLDAVDSDTLQKFHPTMRIGPGSARARSPWRPVLAVAAAVAVLATTITTLVHTGRDRTLGPDVAQNDPPARPTNGTPPTVAPNGTTPGVTPIAPALTPAVPETAAAGTTVEEHVAFSVVPSYESFAISVPSSLTLASIDEYDRQAREAADATTADDAARSTATDANIQ